MTDWIDPIFGICNPSLRFHVELKLNITRGMKHSQIIAFYFKKLKLKYQPHLDWPIVSELKILKKLSCYSNQLDYISALIYRYFIRSSFKF